MTAHDLIRSVETTSTLELDSLSERLVYLYLRYHADKKSIVRLSMSELAADLGVNRQTILKHIRSLLEKHLTTHIGHGRYRVHAEPWSMGVIFTGMLRELNDGDIFNLDDFCQRLYGERVSWSSDDPRADEIDRFLKIQERLIRIHTDSDGDLRKGATPKKVLA